jgi:hypothetical protein
VVLQVHFFFTAMPDFCLLSGMAFQGMEAKAGFEA